LLALRSSIMASVGPFTQVHYPESDGKPLGESDKRRDAMVRHIQILQEYYRDQRAYVSGDLLCAAGREGVLLVRSGPGVSGPPSPGLSPSRSHVYAAETFERGNYMKALQSFTGKFM